MKEAIFYLMSWRDHLPYLVVSLRSLRQWWDGPVRVYAWPESFSLVLRICKDPRLDAIPIPATPEYRGKNDQFLHKIKIAQGMQDVERVMYLDADTLVRESPAPILAAAECGFAATQFNDWTTTSSMIWGRVSELKDVAGIDQDAVGAVRGGYPSVNGGVWACRPSSPVLSLWHAWTWLARGKFIADEKVLHLMQARFPGEFAVMTGGRWNCSPKYCPASLPEENVAVWHFHGDSNVRPNKSERGLRLWWPLYQECLSQNVGGIAEWKDQAPNKWIAALENGQAS